LSKASKFLRKPDKISSLASSCLKYYAISNLTGLPWSKIVLSEDSNRKPVFKSAEATVEFNVSHQAGLVVIAARIGKLPVGVDVVNTTERDPLSEIAQTGWSSWLSMFEDIFSVRDIQRITNGDEATNEAQLARESTVNEKVSRFYAYWCLKEAYIKMTGEALFATWLKDLEFTNVIPPEPTDSSSPLGNITKDVKAHIRGNPVQDVAIELVAFEKDFMFATATKKSDGLSSSTTDEISFLAWQKVTVQMLHASFEQK
jgi:4'-phosphopantetheinyl transferase